MAETLRETVQRGSAGKNRIMETTLQSTVEGAVKSHIMSRRCRRSQVGPTVNILQVYFVFIQEV